MGTYVMLTRLMPEAVKTPGELKCLEKAVANHVREDVPQAVGGQLRDPGSL
jgi:hypothetical protein